MATRMMLMTSKNNVPLQLLRLMKEKTVVKSFPTVLDLSVFCGGSSSSSWTMPRKDEEVKDGFIREMRNANLELLEGKSIGVEMRGRPMVSDEDDDDDDEDFDDDEEIDDFDDGDVVDDEDGDFDSDDDDEEVEDVRKFRK